MVRYFLVVSRPPTYGLAVLVGVTVLGLVTTWLNPRDLDSSLGMILFVHVLLASSGFTPAARRGHFDPMLVHGRARGRAVGAQWIASILPGSAAWALVALAGMSAGSGIALPAVAGRLAALWIVSSMAWCAGFLLPRGAGGAIWIGVLVVLLLWHADLLAAGRADTALAVLRGGATLLLCPFLLLGTHVPVGAAEIGAAIAGSALVLLLTVRAGATVNVFLVERS